MATGIFGLIPSLSPAGTLIAGDLAPRGAPNSELNVADVLILQRAVIGAITLTADESLVADVAPLGNPDGLLNAADVAVLMRAVLGEITLPPITSNGPPTITDIGLVSVSDPVSGRVQITGAAGSVAGGDTVVIVNYETGDQVSVSVNADGSFVASISGDLGNALSIVAQDSSGNPGPAVTVGVGEIIDVQVASPLDGSQIVADSVLVSGIINAPPNTGVTVNGQVACVIGNQFYADNVSLAPGSNNLVISTVTMDGITQSVTRTVSSNGPAPMRLVVDSPCGYAAHTAKFEIVNDSGRAIRQINVDYDGDGVIDLSTSDPTVALEKTYQNPGAYPVTATITDDLGASYSLSATVVAIDVSVTDGMLQGVYTTMKDRLRRGATVGALNTVSAAVYEQYSSIFSSLGSNMAAVVDQLGVISSSAIGPELAEYVIERSDGGLTYDYMIYLMRGEDGVWRINNM